jgi:hypothetical protein
MGFVQKINTDGSITCAAAASAHPDAQSDGQVYSSDSNQPSNPSFEYIPFLPLPGIVDSEWTSYGTTNGTTTHSQISPGGRVTLSNDSSVPEVHGRYVPVSAAADFSHVFGLIANFGGNYSGQDMGVFFTDGTKYSACALHGASGDGNESAAGYYGAVSNAYVPTSYTVSSGLNYAWSTAALVYFRLSWTLSTHTLACQISPDGFSWLSVWTDTTPQLSPAGVGFYVYSAYGQPAANQLIAWGYR